MSNPQESLERSGEQQDLGNLIVFSHLRWDFVTQRPQHIITRLAKTMRVLFVEEPIGFQPGEEGTANLISVAENVTVLQPKIDPADLLNGLEKVLQEYGSAYYYPDPILWFYSAAFHEMTERLPHSLIIYDCMDELSAFKGASPLLVAQEKTLLQKADLVFTGGKSLYEAKKQGRDAVYCYPSSVDHPHFTKALDPATDIPEDIRHIAHPVVGYYGVIDERIDYDLLGEISALHPDVSFVMIGPVVKVQDSDLPRAQNLHYLGMKTYQELPGYLKAFDIAMMPFALNESTRFISPTKTLEYIAAHKAVISTPIYDVVRDYSFVIPIVRDGNEFSSALQDLLKEDEVAEATRTALYLEILDAVSWDKTVASMQQNIAHVRSAIQAKQEEHPA